MILPHDYRGNVLKVQNVSLVLGGSTILREVEAVVRDVVRPGVNQGQVISVLGPSGIGKTQLFKILAGLQRSTTGTVLLNTEEKPVVRGQVGVVFQNYPLFPHHTVLGNLVLAAKRGGMKAVEGKKRALELLNRFGLTDRAGFYPASLSGGQQQRIAIIQQMLCSSHFLLMDEPFSGLDPNMKDEACRLILDVSRMDDLNTVVVITHDIMSAVVISDTIWLLGRDHAPDGSVIPGARIVEVYDLIERGIAWNENIGDMSEAAALARELRMRFKDL
jgi:NitT/TauT family transport system ATP-binding protein